MSICDYKLFGMLYILLFLYIVIALTLVVGLLITGVRPSKTLAWLLAIFTIPVAGILFYLMLGRNQRKNRLLKRKRDVFRDEPISFDEYFYKGNPKYGKLMRLIGRNCNFPPTEYNEVQFLKDGKTTFETIFGALESASSFIYIQYYIFEEGELADKLLELFKRKMAEGVVIRLIYDSIGSYTLSKRYLKQLRSIGVEVYSFLPFRFGRYLSSLNYRNHRKIIVIDGLLGFTGGINISDKYLKGDATLGKWHDMHLKLGGNSVKQLEATFIEDWYLVSQQKLELCKLEDSSDKNNKGSVVQIAKSGPEDDFPTIEQVYLSIITEADDYLYIVNPYIIPSPEILQALQTSALGGVDVRLLLSEKGDSKLVDLSVRSYFEPLLKAGVRLFLFPDGFLHSKIMVSDGDIVSVGTANIDVRSFEHNYEVNAILYDEECASFFREDFLADCIKSIELTYSEFKERSLPTRLLEGAAKVFSPLL